MGVNMPDSPSPTTKSSAKLAKMEIVRRYFQTAVEAKRTGVGEKSIEKLEMLMNQAGVTSSFSPALSAALLKEQTTGAPRRRHGAA